MRFLPTRVHGVIGYLWGLALMAAPWWFGFAAGGAAQWTAIVFGAGAILYSALTDYEAGLFRILPMRLHLRAFRNRRPSLLLSKEQQGAQGIAGFLRNHFRFTA